ncbi:MAG: UDP-N-acetylglucosamine--LPS N-acetylglucosamine transferase [Chthoniobacteraceae bacterium]
MDAARALRQICDRWLELIAKSFHAGRSIPRRNIRVLAVASGGGHWVQLQRLRPAFDGCDVAFASVKDGYRTDVSGKRFYVIPDSNMQQKIALVRTAIMVLLVLLRERPQVIISTGAAPGYFAVFFGKWMGARTIWLDSVANAEKLSLSGEKAGRYADLWLTQWAHLARESGPRFYGSVL